MTDHTQPEPNSGGDADDRFRESNVRVIADPETLRLIADPLRLRLLELLREQPRTVTELASLVGVRRTKLYYHIKLLEAHDLIAVDETKVVSGITEKRYRVTAYQLSVDKALLGAANAGREPLDMLLSFILGEAAADIRRAVQAGLIDLDRTQEDIIAPRRLMIGRSWYRLAPDDVEHFSAAYGEFREKLAGLQGFEPQPGPDLEENPDAPLYEWLVGFYPIVTPGMEPDERRSR
jgi:DNA-binding transcriptional ArsR family regulator